MHTHTHTKKRSKSDKSTVGASRGAAAGSAGCSVTLTCSFPYKAEQTATIKENKQRVINVYCMLHDLNSPNLNFNEFKLYEIKSQILYMIFFFYIYISHH